MTHTRFSKEHLQARLEHFHHFLQEHRLACYPLPQATEAHPSFIVYHENALMQVTFSFAGGIRVVGLPSSLRETVMGWVQQEQPHYRDQTEKEKARKDLGRYRFLLATSPEISKGAAHDKQRPEEGVALSPGDHPLVEVLSRFGYQVHLFSTAPRYRLLQGQRVLASGEHLTDVVVALFSTHTHHDPLGREDTATCLPVVETSAVNGMLVSLTDLSERLPHENLELSCVLALPVRLLLYHPHTHRDLDPDHPELERDYFCEVKIPPVSDPVCPFKSEHVTHGKGDGYLLGEVFYPSWSRATLRLKDIVRATGIDPTARIWFSLIFRAG